MELDLWSIERAHYAQGCKVICGVDEAGRGPLAGPVCAAAVILPPDLEIPGLNGLQKALRRQAPGAVRRDHGAGRGLWHLHGG